MHLLRRLRGTSSLECLPELRRRIRAAPYPSRDRATPRPVPRQAAAFDRAGDSQLWQERDRGVREDGTRHSAGAAVAPFSSPSRSEGEGCEGLVEAKPRLSRSWVRVSGQQEPTSPYPLPPLRGRRGKTRSRRESPTTVASSCPGRR